MLYRGIKFSSKKNHPFFYTNFVQTLDGKVAVKENDLPAGRQGYWPIGSKGDYEVLEELRSYADCLIHGGNLAREFGEVTLKNINKPLFQQIRRVLGKSTKLPYYAITNKPGTLKTRQGTNLIHLRGENLKELVDELKEKGYKHILVEGGPTLLGSFLKENLIDEVFLTISPKIFGTSENTKTLVEGQLFPPDQIKSWELLSVKKVKNELFLRYKMIK